ALGKSELGTLEKTRWERQTLKNLKAKRKDAEAKQESDYAHAKSRLQSELEKARAIAKQNLDQTLAKLDAQQESIDELSTEIQEWVTLKTGSAPSTNSAASDSIPPRSLAHIESLSAMAKEFEAIKANYIEKKKTLQSNRTATIVSAPLLLIIALLAGGSAFAIASLFKASPLILAIAALLAAVLLPILVYLAALPLVGSSIRSSLSGLLEDEQNLGQLLDRGRAIAEATLKREYTKLDQQHQQNLTLASQKHQELLEKISVDYQAKKTATIESTVRDKANYSQQRISAFNAMNTQFPEQLGSLKVAQDKATAGFQQKSKATLDSLNAAFRYSQKYLTTRWIDGIKALDQIGKTTVEQIQERFPSWNSDTFSTEQWSRDEASLALPLGHFKPTQPLAKDHPAKSRPVEFQMLRELASKLESIGQLPLTYDIIGNGGLILRTEDPECREQAHLVMRNLLLRAVTALPAGMLQVTVIDPEGLGKKYSWLMHLADIDPELVNHRVWTQPIHIANELALTTRHIEDVIQQSLRNQFRNLYEYNQKAGPMAIPYRIIVWSGFPFGLDDASWQSLCSILSSGSRCGVGVLIDWPASIQWPTFADTEKLTEFALLGRIQKSSSNGFDFSLDVPELKSLPGKIESPPDESTVAAIMDKHLVAAANIGKRIVPFSSIASQPENQHSRSSADGLEIPIGISDSGRIQSLVLGEGTSQHVLIAGKTGSGKSSLLHTMISSAALEYPPEELRLVLLDFKKGVEFQVYSELQLSHTDIIGIESRREFGLSTLEYLDRILSARGEAFRQWGVQDLPSLKRNHPDIR
ncbi:MAG: FtsK/SpoIIIE domain-containing protein, partial [Pirellula sp.]